MQTETTNQTHILTNQSTDSRLWDAHVPPSESLVTRVVALVNHKSYDEAAELLRTAPRSKWASTTLGVCLLRSGHIDEALQIYRSLVLKPGSTLLRENSDDLSRINFATALMLKGTPSGALEVLSDLHSPHMQPAVRVRDAITRWSNSLSFWRRLEWKLNRIDPPNSRVPIDFEPGEFTFAVQRARNDTPSQPTARELAV